MINQLSAFANKSKIRGVGGGVGFVKVKRIFNKLKEKCSSYNTLTSLAYLYDMSPIDAQKLEWYLSLGLQLPR
jgi:hypothetical protein